LSANESNQDTVRSLGGYQSGRAVAGSLRGSA